MDVLIFYDKRYKGQNTFSCLWWCARFCFDICFIIKHLLQRIKLSKDWKTTEETNLDWFDLLFLCLFQNTQEFNFNESTSFTRFYIVYNKFCWMKKTLFCLFKSFCFLFELVCLWSGSSFNLSLSWVWAEFELLK
jgi:hypothetical protein